MTAPEPGTAPAAEPGIEPAPAAEPGIDAGAGAASDPVTCALCGTSAATQPLTWSTSTGPRGVTLTCAPCTRTHLRSLEAKLDEEFW